MNAGTEQQERKFKAGIGTWVRSVLAGLICAVIFPILPNLLVNVACGGWAHCFQSDYSLWAAGIAAAIGLIGGMLFTYNYAARAYKKQVEDPPYRPETLGDRRTEMMVERRKADARAAWLTRLGRERGRGGPNQRGR